MAGFSPPFKPIPEPADDRSPTIEEDEDAVRAYREWRRAQPAVVRTLHRQAAYERADLLAADDDQSRLAVERDAILARMKTIEKDLDELQDELVRHGYRMADDGTLEKDGT